MKGKRLRNIVTVQQREETRGADGSVVAEWITFFDGWRVNVKPLSGNKQFFVKQQYPTATHQVTGRWIEGLTTKMRLLYDDRYLNIDSIVDVDELGIELDLTCTEKL